LQEKWKVSGFRLVLILCTFAIGGSATGWLGKLDGVDREYSLWSVYVFPELHSQTGREATIFALTDMGTYVCCCRSDQT